MSINATLIAQMIVFLILIWFTMKFIWPPLTRAMDDRAKRIAEGLSAAERARKELADADARVAEEIKKARVEASGDHRQGAPAGQPDHRQGQAGCDRRGERGRKPPPRPTSRA